MYGATCRSSGVGAVRELFLQFTIPPPYLMSQTISIIIPVLNEATTLPRTLSELRNVEGIEAIVVDGGSGDETIAIAESFGVSVLRTPPGRAGQMNAGAKVATGEILLFLHGDTGLPEGFSGWVRQLLADPQVVAGAFELNVAAPMPGVRAIEAGVKWRSHYCQLPYGDQAIFLRTRTFWDLGGFPDLPIMEDFVLVRQLRKRGRIAIAPLAVVTSGRRWQKLGLLRTTLINQIVILGYFLGVPPTTLADWYRAKKSKKI